MAPKKKSTAKDAEAPGTEKESEVAAEEPKAEAKEEEEKAVKEEEKSEAPKEEEAKAEAEAPKASEPEKPAAPEEPKELEEDAPVDSRPKVVAGAVKLSEWDSTINVMPCVGSNLVMSLGEAGMQYLLASARATAGIKAGRYMFEARVAEQLSHAEPNPSNKVPLPKSVLRIGLSLAGSSLFLGDTQDSICFDSEGFFTHGKKRTKLRNLKFARDKVALLVNLDESSPNAHTVSLFKNGVRMCPPQPIPENLRGKTLYPTLTYRNYTLEANFGPDPMQQLPFKCTMVGAAAAADVELVERAMKEKCEVLFPVGLPDQGYFDWMDGFLAKNPDFTELSDRKIIEWAYKSGILKPKGPGSNDKPNMTFGIPLMDDGSIRRVLVSIAPALRRNYVVGELKANLVPKDRKEALEAFSSQRFAKTAAVLMGAPSQDYVESVHASLLADKVAKAEAEKKRKVQEAERKQLLEEKKRKAEEARKARIAAQKKKAGVEEEAVEEKEVEAPVEENVVMEDVAPVELTEEDKKIVHIKHELPDLAEKVIAKSFTSFALPTKEEGFDNLRYEWQQENDCAEILKEYIHKLKMTQKAEDLQPGTWFKEQKEVWTKQVADWRKKQTEWKDPVKKKAILAKKVTKDEDGKEVAPMQIDMEELDVFAVEDVNDVGTGEPLFAEFVYEDWTLLNIRYELHLLLHAFKMDLNDPERPSFQESHLAFYYNKYYKKNFQLVNYDCSTVKELCGHIKDSISLNESSKLLEALLPEDTAPAHILKFVEEHRRDRQRRVDAGDETALLKFARPSPAPPARPPAATPSSAGTKRPYQPTPARPGGQAPPQKQARTGGYVPQAQPPRSLYQPVAPRPTGLQHPMRGMPPFGYNPFLPR